MKITIEGGSPTLRRILLSLLIRHLPSVIILREEDDSLTICNPPHLAGFL